MPTVILDAIRGNSGKWKGANPDTAPVVDLNRTAVVLGLLSPNGYDRLHEAILELYNQTGIQIGSPHPAEPLSILRNITPETMEVDVVSLKLEYKTTRWSIPTYSLGGSVEQKQVNEDWEGDPIEVSYEFPDDYPELERAGKNETTGVIVNKNVPRVVLQVKRTEYFDLDGTTPITADQILQRSKLYMGKVNSVQWNVDPSADALTWLCTQITGVTRDYSFSFEVSYTFVYSDNEWRQRVTFIDPNTGKPPPGVAQWAGSATKNVRIYQAENFNALQL